MGYEGALRFLAKAREFDPKDPKSLFVEFTVRADAESAAALAIGVLDPSGSTRVDATVEIWPDDPADGRERPLATASARRNADAEFRGLPAGSYRITARAERYVDGQILAQADVGARVLPPDRVVAHVNWTVNLAQKVERLKKLDLWYLD